jgi:hypothetical protein
MEAARLDLLALFRASDRMDLTPAEIPQRLIRQLFELDADYVEALWGLDQPPGKLNLATMLRDTLAALQQLPDDPPGSAAIFHQGPTLVSRDWKSPSARNSIRLRPTIQKLNPAEAYNMVPGRDPQIERGFTLVTKNQRHFAMIGELIVQVPGY